MVALGQAPGIGQVHQIGTAAEHRDRIAAGDAFADRRHVGHDAVIFLGPAQGQAETRDHLVEDQHDAVLVGEFAQPLEKTGFRRQGPLHGLDDHRRKAVGLGFDQGPGCFEVVPRRDADLALHRLGDARRIGHGLGERCRFPGPLVAHQCIVVHAVKGAFEFHDLLAPGERPGDAHGKEGRFRSAVVEADFLGAGHALGDGPGEFDGPFVDQ